ncbi:galectin-9-like isoform X2 [Trichomycterus rosablanca]|uniref:galectin-9-like isoform X2 n=1 Tax=Trichomycterus rosablanca TaxID=2290929 RepID=UPI002F35D28F
MAYQNPYFNPKLPFMGFIQGGLYEGKSITLIGRVKPDAERFHVNLQCGIQASADIALHFNPRYTGNSGYVVCNTLQSSSWGTEERSNHTPLPRGSNFILTFLVNRDYYSVSINQSQFWNYLHRLPVSYVNAISVQGGVEITSITFQNTSEPLGRQRASHNKKFVKTILPSASLVQPPPQCRAQPAYEPLGRQRASHNKKLVKIIMPNASLVQPHSLCTAPLPLLHVLPYKAVIRGGFYPGKAIIIQGSINPDADSFSINLRHNSEIAFHFNPRFNENVVVCNSLMKDIWGPEERAGGMPFYRGQQFTVNITCDFECFRVTVDGVQMFTYNHRHLLFQQIDILEVEGNISLRHVTV